MSTLLICYASNSAGLHSLCVRAAVQGDIPLKLEALVQALCSPRQCGRPVYLSMPIMGCRIGFRHSSPLHSATSNMQSASEHPEIIPQCLQDELFWGCMLCPFSDSGALPPLQINRFGVIPKGNNTGRWRLISDL